MKNLVVLDCEVYPNYFLAAFKNRETHKVVTVEIRGSDSSLDGHGRRMLRGCMVQGERTTFGFNTTNYDMPIILFALKGRSASDIHKVSDFIINSNSKGWQTMQKFGLDKPDNFKHFDIQQPAPGVMVSLKLYGARMDSAKLQDLPIEPGTTLTEEEMDQIKLYCVNDLNTTIELYDKIEDSMKLRVDMSRSYGHDLMSKSDAQIAEVLIKSELSKKQPDRNLKAPKIPTDSLFKPKIPDFIKFETKQLQDLLELVKDSYFGLGKPNKDGKPGKLILPKELGAVKIKLGISTYKIGIGGLHSTEKKQTIVPGANQILADRDVASYYPAIIINNKLYPKHLGVDFLDIYEKIMETRLKAKKEGDAVTNASLKIVLNGIYGKLGDCYSVIYSPDLLVTVTLIGQLSLLMLIEKLESRGISVVSANTDGFVSLMNKDQYPLYDLICFDWELITNFTLEECMYKGLYSRDVNNYLAVTDSGVKAKGAFATNSLSKNPGGAICATAAVEFLVNNTPIEKTIKECKDVTQFLFARTVNGGAVCDGKYLGRVVRWIYSTNGDTIYYKPKVDLDLVATRKALKEVYNLEKGDPILKILKKPLRENYPQYEKHLVYKHTTPKVPKSDKSRPIMELKGFPDDIDYPRYVSESLEIITSLGL